MLKNIQTRIILTIMIVAILTISIICYFFLYEIINMENGTNQFTELIIKKGIVVCAVLVTTFIIICVITLRFADKLIVIPISKLIESAEKVADGNDIQNIDIVKGKENTDIEELQEAFQSMTKNLKENLNEVTRQKRQVETILLHITDGIIAFNIDGSIIHINPAASRLLKITSKENTFDKIFKKLNTDINMEKMIYLGNLTSTEQKIKIDDEYVNMFFAPFKDENDKPAGIIVLIQDITEHVELDNMRREFIADVSHELKTPLTSIMGYAETLAEIEGNNEMQQRFLKVITTEAVRMTKLVTDLLTLSKFDDNKSNWEKTEFDLGVLVKQCQENLQIELDKKNLKTECFVTADVPLVYADKDGIERVILNIISNSIKYTKENGFIKIYVGFLYSDAYIKIIDNGIGIPEADLGKIFERFYRVDKARTRAMGGTGLRLINCEGNIRQK